METREREVDIAPTVARAEALPGQPSRLPDTGTAAPDGPVGTRRLDEPPPSPVPTDRVTLHLPEDIGGGRIQIAVRGEVVHARIIATDEAGARAMEGGLDQLRATLVRQGFHEAQVRVEGPTQPAEGGWLSAAAAKESAGADDHRPQDPASQDRRERYQERPDDPRPDPRRQQPDGRSQQRSRRERER